MRRPAVASHAEAVVVLGAAVDPSGAAGPAVRRRVAHAVDVLARRRIATLVVSGGKGERGASEAEVMRDLALGHGVPRERIVLEDRSRNTFENAVYTGRIMMDRGWRTVIVVTDSWHMRRALFVFRRLGLPCQGDPARRPPDVPRLTWARSHVEEAVAFAHSAYLFRSGAHKPIVAAVWRR